MQPKRYQAIDLLAWLDRHADSVGSGPYLVLTNARGEQVSWALDSLRPWKPQLVIGVDEERELFRLVDFYHTDRRDTAQAKAELVEEDIERRPQLIGETPREALACDLKLEMAAHPDLKAAIAYCDQSKYTTARPAIRCAAMNSKASTGYCDLSTRSRRSCAPSVAASTTAATTSAGRRSGAGGTSPAMRMDLMGTVGSDGR